MTPFAALYQISRAAEDRVHLVICDACARALVMELCAAVSEG